MKLYDLVKSLLEESLALRDSDRRLIWAVWIKTGHVEYNSTGKTAIITTEDFMRAPSTESIRRARQLIQAKYPELRGSESVTAKRKEKEETKGTFVFSEEVKTQQKLL